MMVAQACTPSPRTWPSVSYTHLDVYKRQGRQRGPDRCLQSARLWAKLAFANAAPKTRVKCRCLSDPQRRGELESRSFLTHMEKKPN